MGEMGEIKKSPEIRENRTKMEKNGGKSQKTGNPSKTKEKVRGKQVNKK